MNLSMEPAQQQQTVSSIPQNPPIGAQTPPVVIPPMELVQPAQSSSQPSTSPQSVLDVLLQAKDISQDQYDAVLLDHINTGRPVETILEEKKLVTEEVLAKAKAAFYNVPYVALAEVGVFPEALEYVQEQLARRYHMIPFAINTQSNTLSVAFVNPLDLGAIDFLEKKTGLRVLAYYATPSDIERSIAERYAQTLSQEVTAAMRETETDAAVKVKTFDAKNLGEVIREAPIAKIVETILTFAIKARASDVHIEPQEDKTRVRYRIDGILHEKLILPKTVQDAVVSRIKILSGLKIDEKRIPQDGRFTFRVEKEEVDLRISTLPTVHGEKIVMRLLKKTG